MNARKVKVGLFVTPKTVISIFIDNILNRGIAVKGTKFEVCQKIGDKWKIKMSNDKNKTAYVYPMEIELI